MSKRFLCKIGLHHWHYDCKCGEPFNLYVIATCHYCGKEEYFGRLTANSWFLFGESWIWDKHNKVNQAIFNKYLGKL